MMKTSLKDVEKIAENFCNDVEAIKKELKRVQSIKCRLKKQRGKKTFEEEMTEVIKYQQILKDATQLLANASFSGKDLNLISILFLIIFPFKIF